MTKRSTSSSLRVRTNLHAGLTWEEVSGKASELWGNLSSAVSGAVNNLTSGSSTTTKS